MALNLKQKQAIVAEVAEWAQSSISAVASDYRGLTVSQMTSLRKNARDMGVQLRVVRNTLARRAVADTDFSCMADQLVGPLVLAFSKDDPGAPARLMRNFAKDNDQLKVKVIAINGETLPVEQIDAVASLPTREEALARLMAALQAPITKLVRTLAEPHTKLVRTFAALRDQKQA